MQIKLVGSGKKLKNLETLVLESLNDLGLTDIIKLEKTDDSGYKIELGITQNPALCVEEESIDFKDMIFEGIIPEKDEIKSMFVSIIGGSTGDSCSTESCMTCVGC
ncbi:MAG: hypothetical protein PHF46_02630 [Candidatus Gracilibacteria bacterium]|nr:hypothetical protein [Candidatus Gracilibacteria bacterium]MDD3120278.1 hypothetical protein [Candidatus Gracilibacteria bacterium]MDD4530173.1 hypothetical protein [Candidatus Gracilibacteria bacterium]